MTQALAWAACGTGFTFLMTALGAAAVFCFPGEPHPRFRQGMLGFAAGVMTAAAVWSLLLPAIDRAADLALPPWLPAGAGVLAGAAFLAGMDAVLVRLRTGSLPFPGSRRSALLAAAITLHNIPEGMAVGLAFALAVRDGGFAAAAALALGIGIQNFPEGMAISLPLRQEGLSRRRAFWNGAMSGAVEPLFGIPAALFAVGITPLMPWVLSFAAGAMLYVVAEELIPQAHRRMGTCSFLCGFLVMMSLDVALG
jgi:ZIP family zinc transporter